MKSFLILLTLVSSSLWARTSDCLKEASQADKNECMSYERDKAVGELVKKVTEKCTKDLELEESEGGSIYPMLLDECLAKEFRSLKKSISEDGRGN